MDNKYVAYTKILKAIADPKRLKIVDLLSGGELCACKIQQEFHITQPTLSHDMKILYEAGIITCRREGKWIYYGLHTEQLADFYCGLGKMITGHEPSCKPPK